MGHAVIDKELLHKLSQIGIKLSTEHDLDTLLSLILREARAFTHADAGTLYEVDGNELVFRVSQNETLDQEIGGMVNQWFREFRLTINEKSIAGTCASRRETLRIDDVQSYPGYNKSMDEKTGYRTLTMLVVPMHNHRRELIGVLQLINARDPDTGEVAPFDEDSTDIVESLASQAAVALENTALLAEVSDLFESMVKYSAKAIDARDPTTAGHSARVSAYALRVAKRIGGFSDGQLRRLRFAGLLHDIGKIGVPESILTKENKLYADELRVVQERFRAARLAARLEVVEGVVRKKIPPSEAKARLATAVKDLDDALAFVEAVNKPGRTTDEQLARLQELSARGFRDATGRKVQLLEPHEVQALSIRYGNLTEDERTEMENHALYSYEILRQIPFRREFENLPAIAAAHHERLDGTGYPMGLDAEHMPLESRILAVVDVFEAVTAQDRPYRPPMEPAAAMGILRDGAEKGWYDAQVVAVVEDLVAEGLLGPKSLGDAEADQAAEG